MEFEKYYEKKENKTMKNMDWTSNEIQNIEHVSYGWIEKRENG